MAVDNGETSEAGADAKDAEIARLRALLREHEARTDIFAALSGDDLYTMHIMPTGSLRYLWGTASFTHITGYDPAELDARGWETLIHPEDRAILPRRVAALRAGETDRREYRILTKSGEICWLRDSVRPADAPEVDGTLTVYGVARDVTAEKRAAATGERLVAQARAAGREADAERQRLRDLFNHAPALIAVMHGPNHVFEFANPEYARVSGRRVEDLIGKTMVAAFAEAVAAGDPVSGLLDRVYRTGEPFIGNEVSIMYDRDGDGQREQAFFNFVYQPTKDTAGRVRGILFHGFEVTEEVRARRRTERLTADLRAGRDRLQQVLNVLPEAVLIADTTPTFLMGNSAARDLLGVDVAGQPAPVGADETAYTTYSVRHLDGTLYPPSELPLQRALMRGETVRGDRFLLRNAATGAMVPVLANAVPLRDDAGAVTGGVVIFQDITSIRDLEHARDEFLSSASHDLKGPLTSIRGYTQLAQRRLAKLPEAARGPVADALTGVDDAANRMLALINELADITRSRMGVSLDLQRAPTDLVALARHVAEQLGVNAPQQIIVEASTPALIADVDPARIERVLTNLVLNAVKYSPDAPTITVRVREDAGRAVIAVQDSGIGIPAADLPTIWERFTRAGNVTGRISGSGIGLASARDIITQHGGSVAVESTLGVGSTFTVALPLTPAPPSPQASGRA